MNLRFSNKLFGRSVDGSNKQRFACDRVVKGDRFLRIHDGFFKAGGLEISPHFSKVSVKEKKKERASVGRLLFQKGEKYVGRERGNQNETRKLFLTSTKYGSKSDAL